MKLSTYLAGAGALLLAGCGADPEGPQEPVASTQLAVSAPLPAAHCSIDVVGQGTLDLEGDYLPHVITCENGGADLEALKAQAIAARSVAYYNIATSGSICNSQGCQVYSCGATPHAKAIQAVQETAGKYLSFNGVLTYGFYVAGYSGAAAPGCLDTGGSTSHFVTYNEGKSGTAVEQTNLGSVQSPTSSLYGQNRGCMSQHGARCLESGRGYGYEQILRFYYGQDIEILQATGPCVSASAPASPTGYLDAASCEVVAGWAQDPDTPDAPLDVHVYFGGPAGAGQGVATVADRERSDLCAALGSCNHGFALLSPYSLHDGQPHPLHAYAINVGAGESQELAGSPRSLSCTPPLLTGTRRHVQNPVSLAEWKFSDLFDVAPAGDAAIDALPAAAAWPAAPVLVKSDSGGAIYLVDHDTRRHVPSPAAFAAWHFAFDDIAVWPAAQLNALTEGPALGQRPLLVRRSDGALFVVDHAGALDVTAPSSSDVPLRALLTSMWSNAEKYRGPAAHYEVCAGADFEIGFTFKNTGSVSWRDVPGVGSGIGDDVFLVTANGALDGLTQRTYLSLKENLNSHVSSELEAANCSTQDGCRRTSFVAGGLSAQAPKKPGIYSTRWRLRDYSQHWGGASHGFGPIVELRVSVRQCKPAPSCSCKFECSGSQFTVPAECSANGTPICSTILNPCNGNGGAPSASGGAAGAAAGGTGSGGTASGGVAGAVSAGGSTGGASGDGDSGVGSPNPGSAGDPDSNDGNGIDLDDSEGGLSGSDTPDDPEFDDYGFTGDAEGWEKATSTDPGIGGAPDVARLPDRDAESSGCSLKRANASSTPSTTVALLLLAAAAARRRRQRR